MLEKLLEAIVKLTEEVSELKRLLIEKQEQPQAEQLLAYTEWLKKEGLLNATVSRLIVKKYVRKYVSK